jgi:hypothetical protein
VRVVIIGQGFAWGHLGKTGGHTTWELFQLFPETIVFADRLGHERQHTPFPARLSKIQGKDLALNIRRLPSWMLSFHMHVAKFGDYPDYRPRPMVSPHEMALSDVADRQLAEFTDHGRLEIDQWLRTEHLLDDFLSFISRYVDVSPERRSRIASFEQKNVGEYDRRLPHWFSSAHVALMYKSNPGWAAIEQKIYAESWIDSAAVNALQDPPSNAQPSRSSNSTDRSPDQPLHTRLIRRLRHAR